MCSFRNIIPFTEAEPHFFKLGWSGKHSKEKYVYAIEMKYSILLYRNVFYFFTILYVCSKV